MKSRVAVLAFALLVSPMTGLGAPAEAVAAVPHASAISSKLNAVTCTSPTNCLAVGEYAPAAGKAKTLIERWNGKTWSIVASPNAPGSDFSRLYGVSCTSPTSCVAVGQQFVKSSNTGKPLIERWNGKAWSIVAGPSVGQFSELHGVSCTSATACIAVGLQFVAKDTCCKTLIERWNGTKWAIVAHPASPKASYSRLDAVTCTSASKCFAVGTFFANNRSNPLVQRWDGSKWAILPSPNPKIGDGGILKSVACTSATNCWAAGSYYLGGSNRPATLIERWNGKTWSIVANPTPARSYNELFGVACSTSSSCMTVGDYSRFGAPPPYFFVGTRTLTQRWTGKAWSIVPSPNSSVPYNTLAGVVCPSATSCVAVGSAFEQGSPTRVLVERWNGKTWSTVSAPDPTVAG